jgi:hypothetical protein
MKNENEHGLNLDDFAPPEQLSSPAHALVRKARQWFLSPAVSLEWHQRTAKLPGKAHAVASALLHLRQLSKSDTLKVSPSLLSAFGVDRKAGYRAIVNMASAGLLEIVERKNGSAAKVRLLNVDPRSA